MLHYLHLDVFTDALFTGNQLAVYLDPPVDLPGDVMQRIAREMNYSETTFVLPPEAPETDIRLRIFTPEEELPMAGHPTIGTAFALAHAGRLRPGQPRTVFGEGVGPIAVDLEWHGEQLGFAWMTQPQPRFGPVLADVTALAAALGLPREAIAPGGLPVQIVDSGVPFLIAPVSTRAAVDAAVADARGLAGVWTGAGWPTQQVYLFTTEPGPDGAHAYSRMFAPGLGVAEDPATGSASGPLGAYLVKYGLVPAALDRPLVNRQGIRMGRPSTIYIEPITDAGDVVAMRVGGKAVLAGTGTLLY